MNRANPNLALVNHLLSLGYTIDQISEAQETLWNAVGSGEGGYDDVVAVEGLLKELYEDETDSEEEKELKEGSGTFLMCIPLRGWVGLCTLGLLP
jgi:hypothetical protein